MSHYCFKCCVELYKILEICLNAFGAQLVELRNKSKIRKQKKKRRKRRRKNIETGPGETFQPSRISGPRPILTAPEPVPIYPPSPADNLAPPISRPGRPLPLADNHIGDVPQ
jgi:hypothetical protein